MLENTLQLSGALGAVASVVLIVLALVVNSSDLTPESRDDASSIANESVALLPTNTALPTMTLLDHVDQTAIAYAGEDLLQSTMLAQSAYYSATPTSAGTPVPQIGMVPGAAEESADMLNQADTDEALMYDSAPAAEGEALGGAVSGDTQASAMGANNEPEVAAAPMADDAPAPLATGAAENSQTFNAAPEGQTQASAANGLVTGTATMVAPTATALPADTGAGSADQSSGQALREADGVESGSAVDSEALEESVEPTSLAVAEAPFEQTLEQPMAKVGAEARDSTDTSDNALLLAAAGVIIFTLSIGLLVLGRKKAHRS